MRPTSANVLKCAQPTKWTGKVWEAADRMLCSASNLGSAFLLFQSSSFAGLSAQGYTPHNTKDWTVVVFKKQILRRLSECKTNVSHEISVFSSLTQLLNLVLANNTRAKLAIGDLKNTCEKTANFDLPPSSRLTTRWDVEEGEGGSQTRQNVGNNQIVHSHSHMTGTHYSFWISRILENLQCFWKISYGRLPAGGWSQVQGVDPYPAEGQRSSSMARRPKSVAAGPSFSSSSNSSSSSSSSPSSLVFH